MVKQKNYRLYLLVLLLIFFTACAGIAPADGLSVRVQPDPASVFTGKTTRIFIDVINNDVKTYKNVYAEIFDMGVMRDGSCSQTSNEIRPGSLSTLQCTLRAPDSITGPVFRNNVHVRATYDSTVSGIAIIEAMTEDEYNRLKDAGKLRQLPLYYSFSDRNLKVEAEFDENPYVFVAGRKYYMKIKITNIGNGFAEQITFDKSTNIADRLGIVNCGAVTLRPVGKEFPTITCELTPQPQRLEGYDIGININYKYDVRASTSVDIVR